MEFKLKLNRGVSNFRKSKVYNDGPMSISEYSYESDKSLVSSKSKSSSISKLRMKKKNSIPKKMSIKRNFRPSVARKLRVVGKSSSFKPFRPKSNSSDDNSSQVSLDVVEENSHISDSESRESETYTNSNSLKKMPINIQGKEKNRDLLPHSITRSPDSRKTPNFQRDESEVIKNISKFGNRTRRVSLAPKKLSPRKTMVQRGSILKEIAMKNIKAIKESSFDQVSSDSRMRSDAITSLARMNETQSPSSSLKRKPKGEKMNDMYLFDIQMEKKVINTTFDVSNLSGSRFNTTEKRSKRNNLCLASKQYGSKWFIPPKKWKCNFEKAKLTEEARNDNGLKTNIALKNMIDSIQGVSKRNPSSQNVQIEVTKDLTKVDLVESFQDDINKIFEEKDDQEQTFV